MAEIGEDQTCSIVEGGRMLGYKSKSASYKAAQEGYLPTIILGKRKRRVPLPALRRLLEEGCISVTPSPEFHEVASR